MNDVQCSDEHAVEVVNVEEGSLSSLNDLPDDLLLLIFNRLIDLKCLCLCSLVSPRFSSLVFHVHSVYLTIPRSTTTTDLIPTPVHPATDGLVKKTLNFFFNAIVAKPLQIFRQFKSVGSIYFTFQLINKFKHLRSLHFLHHSSPNRSNPNDDDDSIYRWATKLSPTIDTFVFLSTSSIKVGGEIDFHEQEQEDPLWLHELMINRATLAIDCLQDAIISHRLLRAFVLLSEHRLLENITITDSNMMDCLSLWDSKIVEMRNWLNSTSKTELNRTQVPVNIHYLHVPVLKLPVSSKVLVSPSLVLMEMVDRRHERRDWGIEATSIASLFSEKGEEEFAEAIVEMMANHNSRMQTII